MPRRQRTVFPWQTDATSAQDLAASKAFYEKFSFEAFAGNAAHNRLILRNGATVIGLFQGMFEKNCLTFDFGWNQDAQAIGTFTDVPARRASIV